MPSQIEILTQTLFANGYLLEEGTSVPGARLLTYSRQDRFGCTLRYLIAFPEKGPTAHLAEEIAKTAKLKGCNPVLLGELGGDLVVPVLPFDEFLARFGGPIVSLLPLEPDYPSQLRTLANNELPAGLSGTASNLFEDYVAAGLQFLFGSRVLAYGTRRTGEAVPDGLALRSGGYLLYDAKAANGGYACSRDEYRKFQEYTEDFHSRYKESYGASHVFLVVSGSFTDSRQSREERSREFFADTKTTVLSFMDVEALIGGIDAVRHAPELREAVNWDKVLVHTAVTGPVIAKAVRKAGRDGLQGDD